MKFFTATTFASTVLMLESLSIQSEAAEIQRLYSEIAYASYGVCESMEDKEGCEGVDFYDPLQSCFWTPWTGECNLVQDEDECELIVHSEDSCNESSGCAWVSPKISRTGEGHCMSYRNIFEDGCVYNDGNRLHLVKSKNKCSDIKGCSWHNSDGKRKSCQVAPTQISCEDFEDKATCRKNGCGWKNKENICLGRWERRFLSFLVGKNAEEAKTAILAEYGESYSVLIEPATHVPDRIKLVVDNQGVIVEAPEFG